MADPTSFTVLLQPQKKQKKNKTNKKKTCIPKYIAWKWNLGSVNSTLKLPVTLEVLCRLSKKTQALNQSIIRAELLQESDTMT